MEVEGIEVRFTVYEVGGKWEEKKKQLSIKTEACRQITMKSNILTMLKKGN